MESKGNLLAELVGSLIIDMLSVRICLFKIAVRSRKIVAVQDI